MLVYLNGCHKVLTKNQKRDCHNLCRNVTVHVLYIENFNGDFPFFRVLLFFTFVYDRALKLYRVILLKRQNFEETFLFDPS